MAVMNSVGTYTDDRTYGSSISSMRSGVGSFRRVVDLQQIACVVSTRYCTEGASRSARG